MMTSNRSSTSLFQDISFENERKLRSIQMTELITSLLNWIETNNPKLLKYGNVNFKHAFECYFYFTGISNSKALLPLMRAAKAWRLTHNAKHDLVELYDQYLAEAIHTGMLIMSLETCKNYRLLSKLLFRRCFRPEMKGPKVAENGAKVVFYALNSRFVYFFKNVITGLGKSNCIFLSLNQKDTIAACEELEIEVLSNRDAILNYQDIDMPMSHPLASAYLLILNQYLAALGTLELQKASCVVFAEGTSLQDELVSQAAKSLNIRTVRIQSGRAGIMHSGYRNMSFDKMLVWGQGIVDRLKPYSDSVRYIITGNPDIQPHNNTNLKQVLFQGVFNHPVITVFTQPICSDITEQDYDAMSSLINKVLSSDLSVHVLVRKHPVDKCSAFEKLSEAYQARLKITQSKDYALNDVFAISDLVVGFYSTTLSEAAAYGKLALLLQLKPSHSVFPYPEKHGAAIAVNNIDQGFAEIKRFLADKMYKVSINQQLQDFADYYFGPRDGNALNRIVSCVESVGVR